MAPICMACKPVAYKGCGHIKWQHVYAFSDETVTPGAISLDNAFKDSVPDGEIGALLPCQQQALGQGLTALQAQTLQAPGCQSVWQTVLWSLQFSTEVLKVECA